MNSSEKNYHSKWVIRDTAEGPESELGSESDNRNFPESENIPKSLEWKQIAVQN